MDASWRRGQFVGGSREVVACSWPTTMVLPRKRKGGGEAVNHRREGEDIVWRQPLGEWRGGCPRKLCFHKSEGEGGGAGNP